MKGAMAKKKSTAKKNAKAKVKRGAQLKTTAPRKSAVQTLDLRYPYTGYRYRAEGPHRIRVDRGDMWGYFDAEGFWLEGPLKSADGPFCRYMSSNWIIAARAGKVRAQ
jgi:hypothetical protein